MIATKKQTFSQDATTNLYKVVRVLGMDNLNRTWLYNLYSFQLIFASCVLQLVGFLISYIRSISTMSISTLLNSLQVALNISSLSLKVIVLFIYMPSLRQTAPILSELDEKIFDKEEQAVARTMIRVCKFFVALYMTAFLSYSVVVFLGSAWSGHPPFGSYIPYCHWEDSTTKMIIATLLEFYLFNISCVQDVALDGYSITFVYMARMHMKMLCIRIEKLGSDPKLSEEDNVKMLVECIKTHKKIIELIETVRPIISKTLFIQLIASVAITAIPILNIMLFAESLSSKLSSIIFMAAFILETLPMCFIMNVLVDEINSLPTAIFHSSWVDRNKAFRHTMVFFMQNAQKFNVIMAGNILPIDVATFLSIGKLGFSIYALVDKAADRSAAHAT